MLFILLNFCLSQLLFNVSSESIRSLVLYFSPRDTIEVEVNSNLHTYFSDFSKATGISLEIETNDSSTIGPYTYHSHLDGIDFGDDYSSYKLTFINEGDYVIKLAVIFAEDLQTALDIIRQNFSNYDFPILDHDTDEFKFFYNAGLLFHEKRYSTAYFVGIPTVLFLLQ